MKCGSDRSDTSSNGFNCSLKLRILALVVITANLINERTTRYMSNSHAIFAPITLLTTYIFLGVQITGAIQKQYASEFLEIYSLFVCATLQIALSILVFKDLQARDSLVTRQDVGPILNGVLPILSIILITSDLISILLSRRDTISAPAMPPSIGEGSAVSIGEEPIDTLR